MRLRLSLFWFFYMAGLGTFFPFFSLYLRDRVGLTGTQVGLTTAIIPLVGLAAQPFWGQVADRTGSRRLVLAIVSLGVALANLGLGFFEGFVGTLAGTALLALFLTVVLPLATAVSLAALAMGPDGDANLGAQAFGRVRLWGTVGFLVGVVVFPRLPATFLADTSVPWHGLGRLFPITASLSLVAALLALTLPSSPALSIRSRRGDVRRLLRHAPAFRLLVLVFFAHAFLQGPIYLFPLFISELGGDVSTLGNMWILMLLFEIPLIGYAGSTLRRLGPRGVLLMGLLAEVIRWSTCALTENITLVYAVQLLHGVGVAGIIIGAPLYLEQVTPERLRATGQSLVSAAGYGAGAIVSNILGGWLFDHAGHHAPYAMAGIGLAVLCVLLYWWLPEPSRPEGDEVRDESPAPSG